MPKPHIMRGLGSFRSGSLISTLPWQATIPGKSPRVRPRTLSSWEAWRIFFGKMCPLCWDSPVEAAALWPFNLREGMNGLRSKLNNGAHSFSPDCLLMAFGAQSPQARVQAVPWRELWGQTYPRGNGLQSGDVVLQGQAAAVVEHGLHSGHVSLHQLLPLVGCFLLQSLHFLLEMLPLQTHARVTRELNKLDGAAGSSCLSSNFISFKDFIVIPTFWLIQHVLWVTSLSWTPSPHLISHSQSLFYNGPWRLLWRTIM